MTAHSSDMQTTTRFTDRVEDYVRYRPGYPPELIQSLRHNGWLTDSDIVADVGSGTGISSDLFLQAGCQVYGIEPNDAMRRAAETRFAGHPRFFSIASTAENTTLRDSSVDLIAAGQAFHWFRRDATRREFQRILKPGGAVALFWNSRRIETTPFLKEYEAILLRFGTDYQTVNHQQLGPDVFQSFFGGPHFTSLRFPNTQRLDWEGLKGRLLSSSYVPSADDPQRQPMLESLRIIFERYATAERVEIDYDTELHVGMLNP